MKKNEESGIAFKDFKSSVSILEFESVLEIANQEYNKLKKIKDSKDKFEKKAQESLDQINSQAGNMPPGLLEKLLEGLERKANTEMLSSFSDEIRRHEAITDFINRFRTSENQLEYLDFTNKKQ